jgi:hypothetical protein
MNKLLESPIFIIFTLARLIAAILLVWALARHSFNYYEVLRLVVSGVCLFGIYVAFKFKEVGWAWLFGVLVALFNPIFRIPLQRQTWNVIDVAVAALLLITIFLMKPANGKSEWFEKTDILIRLRRFFIARHMKKLLRLATEAIYSEQFDFNDLARYITDKKNTNLLRAYIVIRVAADTKLGIETQMSDLLEELSSSEPLLRDPESHQSIMEYCKAKAEVSLLKAKIEFTMEQQSAEYSYEWALYHAEKAKKGPLTFREREKLRILANQLHAVECKLEAHMESSESKPIK